MVDLWYSSDLHLGHDNTWKTFLRNDGLPLRPFKSSEEMNETIINNHNSLVKPQDHWYCSGDVVINKKFLHLVKLFNGHKRLVLGNHDIFPIQMYLDAGFEKIYGSRPFADDFILSHIPLHKECISSRFKICVHGHMHSNYINDPTYLNITVEHTNYKPLHYSEVKERIKKNQELGYVIDYSAIYAKEYNYE